VSKQDRRNLLPRGLGIWFRNADIRRRWPMLAGVVASALIIGTASTGGVANANESTLSSPHRINHANSNISYERKLAHKDASGRTSNAGASAKPVTKGPRRKAPGGQRSGTTSVAPTRNTSASSTPSQSSGFVERDGTSLTLNGQPDRFVGINIFMAASGGTPASCGGELYPNVDVPLSKMPNGVVIRFWAFQNFFVSHGSFNWTNFDQVLAIAAAHDDKVIPVLANQYSYCDGAAKDLAWYQSGYENTVEPGDVVPYLQYVTDAVNRYANNPTIAMWQLVNEGEAVNRNGSCNESAALAALIAFSNNVGGLIHSHDPNSLVSLGTLAGYSGSGAQWCGATNNDYQTLMASPGSDVCDFHDYGYPNHPMGMPFGPDLATAIEMCHADDKPLMVGETGIMADTTAGLASRAAEFTAKFSAQFGAGVVGELMWEWTNAPDYVFPKRNTTYSDYGVFPRDPSLGVLNTLLSSGAVYAKKTTTKTQPTPH
jgi:mannan endo-1,4-beta-mannosidase